MSLSYTVKGSGLTDQEAQLLITLFKVEQHIKNLLWFLDESEADVFGGKKVYNVSVVRELDPDSDHLWIAVYVELTGCFQHVCTIERPKVVVHD